MVYEECLSMLFCNELYYNLVSIVFLTITVNWHVLFNLTAVQDKYMLVLL